MTTKRSTARKELLDEIVTFLRDSRNETHEILAEAGPPRSDFQLGIQYGEDYITLWLLEHIQNWDDAE